jgi:dipeptidyl aminopeptidase/acylaminoacyl peptidase
MHRHVILLASSLLLAGHHEAWAAPDAAVVADAKAFGARPDVEGIGLSPDGNRLLMIGSGPGRSQFLRVSDLAGDTSKTILRTEGPPEALQWCEFGSDTQLVCQYGGDVRLDGQIVAFTRLITVGVDGKELKPLGTQSNTYTTGLKQFDGRIIDWLPDEPGHVLMARHYLPEANPDSNISRAAGLGVDRVDLATGRVTRIEPARPTAHGYMCDGRGKVRLMTHREERDGTLTGVTRFQYRSATSKEWTSFGEHRGADNSGNYPIAIDADTDSAYVLTETDGRDALFRVKLDSTKARTAVASHPKVDIDSVVRLGHGQKVVGYTYADDRRHIVYFDQDYAKLAASIGKALAGKPEIHFAGASADGSRLLVFATGDTNPGQYYLLERKSKQMQQVAAVRPMLEGRTLAAVQPIVIPAADGVKIPAYLTLPVGGTGKNLPTVVLPHGGPTARDEWGFDWLAQFLAARGYAVIQPNYRGSAGYGEEWLGQNGFQAWQAAIGDITASARHLVAQGIADPSRLVILGWSYGGYAALQSAAIEPNLYKAAVAIAPVTDLSLLKREASGFDNARLVANFVGRGDHLTAGSPLKRAAEIKVPVLMVHGDMDANVGILHSTRMAEALRKNFGKVELLRYKDLDHQLDDSNARSEMLTRIATFLEEAVGK